MLTLSAVVGLWAMARPVNLPRRARLAINTTLAMAGAQVRFYLRREEYFFILSKRLCGICVLSFITIINSVNPAGAKYFMFWCPENCLNNIFVYFRFCLEYQPCYTMFQSIWRRFISQAPWHFLHSLCGSDMKLKDTNSCLKFEKLMILNE